ncbi:hypothetical protein JHK82_029672 [Glycine max]|nr:hypothetical protein JHK82_029672 [Glycine max]KAG5144345.1 hypothetical protein JHK84_029888 [Glycine max]
MSYYNQQQQPPPVGVPPPQGYKPEGYGKEGYPPPGYPPPGYPPPGYLPQQGYPPPPYPAQGYPPPYAPQYAQPPPRQQNSTGPGCLEGWCVSLSLIWIAESDPIQLDSLFVCLKCRIVKESVILEVTISGVSEILNDVIHGAELLRSALGSSLPTSWSLEADISYIGYNAGSDTGHQECSDEKRDTVSAEAG